MMIIIIKTMIVIMMIIMIMILSTISDVRERIRNVMMENILTAAIAIMMNVRENQISSYINCGKSKE